MFKAERVFSHRNPVTGLIEWFFSAREGNFGPFDNKENAAKELEAFVKHCVENGDDGGRKAGNNLSKLSLVPQNEFAYKRKD